MAKHEGWIRRVEIVVAVVAVVVIAIAYAIARLSAS